MGVMVNDICKQCANCSIKNISLREEVHLCIFAKKKIEPGEELRYDYGVQGLPWRKVSIATNTVEICVF